MSPFNSIPHCHSAVLVVHPTIHPINTNEYLIHASYEQSCCKQNGQNPHPFRIYILVGREIIKMIDRSSHRGSAKTNLTSIHENTGSIPGLTQWVKDLVLVRLWCRPAGVAPIQPLAWESPYAMGAALKKKLKKKRIIKVGGKAGLNAAEKIMQEIGKGKERQNKGCKGFFE